MVKEIQGNDTQPDPVVCKALQHIGRPSMLSMALVSQEETNRQGEAGKGYGMHLVPVA